MVVLVHLQRPRQRGTDVLMLLGDPAKPLAPAGPLDLGRGPLDEVEIVRGVRTPRIALAVLLAQAQAGVLRDRVEHAEAGAAVRPDAGEDQALVPQRREEAQRAVAGRHELLGRLDRPAAGEDAEPGEQRLLVGIEQRVAPVDRGAQRPLPLGKIAWPVGEKRDPLLEPLEDRLQRKDAGVCRGELDREREPVEAPADREHLATMAAADVQIGIRGGRARGKQVARVGVGKRRHRVLDLGRHAQQLAARRQHREAWALVEQSTDERRRRKDTLEVVQEEQQLAVADSPRERVLERLSRLFTDVEHLRDRGQNLRRVVDPCEPDEERAVDERARDATGYLEGEARLAGATGTGERHERCVATDELREVAELPIAIDERQTRRRDVARRARPRRRELDAEPGPRSWNRRTVVSRSFIRCSPRSRTSTCSGRSSRVARESSTCPPCAAAQIRAPRVRSRPT